MLKDLHKLKLYFHKLFGTHKERMRPLEVSLSSDTPGLNVIIIVIDCLRYSHLSFTGYFRDTTPFLDSFRTKSRAISSAPWTAPSVATIATGLYPHNHNSYLHGKIKDFKSLRRNLKSIRKDVPTIFEILSVLGYEIYFASAIDCVAFPFKGRLTPKLYPLGYPAHYLIKELKEWVSRRSGPFLAYLQLGDLHGPFHNSHFSLNFFGPPSKGRNSWYFRKISEQQGKRFEEYKKRRITLYDNIIKYLDQQIKDFFSFLEKSKLLDSTLLIITSDHGEEFWEHAKLESKYFYHPQGICGVGHGHNLFNEIIEVPILMDGWQKLRKRNFRKGWVSTADILPTILNLLKIEYDFPTDGEDLFKQKRRRIILSEAVSHGYEKKALIVEKYKLLYAPFDGVKWLFDLGKDPQEQHPILDDQVTSILLEKLKKILAKDSVRDILNFFK